MSRCRTRRAANRPQKRTCRSMTATASRARVGAEMAACVFESAAFDYLDAPVERITGADVPMPYAINLETLAKPQAQNIVNAALRAVNRQM